jgi:hypothetical protein
MGNPQPTIVFQVNLNLLAKETMMPAYAAMEVGMMDVDSGQTHQNSPDAHDRRSTWLSGGVGVQGKAGQTVAILGNADYKHGDTFTLYGSKAMYMRKLYCGADSRGAKFSGEATPDRNLLIVVSVDGAIV